tara:strand:+ start:1244 stop:1555 length:312 start_codon:yes stop_codon:yes gene_type:complete
MLRILLTAFLTLPLQRLQVANNDFVDYLTNLTPLLLLIPKIMRHDEICKNDDDCPLIMRCCEVGTNKYCCTPNNFVKMSYAFQDQEIKSVYDDYSENNNQNFI